MSSKKKSATKAKGKGAPVPSIMTLLQNKKRKRLSTTTTTGSNAENKNDKEESMDYEEEEADQQQVPSSTSTTSKSNGKATQSASVDEDSDGDDEDAKLAAQSPPKKNKTEQPQKKQQPQQNHAQPPSQSRPQAKSQSQTTAALKGKEEDTEEQQEEEDEREEGPISVTTSRTKSTSISSNDAATTATITTTTTAITSTPTTETTSFSTSSLAVTIPAVNNPVVPEGEGPKKLIVVLESACLEAAKVGKDFELLNCDDHINYMRKKGKDPKDARPDITHQCLLTLMDSPLNKAGLLQVYIHTNKNVLIEINPSTRIPRTFKRFAGLMVQLLHKLSIRAADGPKKLLKVIKNPVSDYFPPNSIRVGTSFNAECVRLSDFVPKICSTPIETKSSLIPSTHLNYQLAPSADNNKIGVYPSAVVFVVGAFAHGKIEADYIDQTIAFSKYPLSGAYACAKICDAFEQHWGII